MTKTEKLVEALIAFLQESEGVGRPREFYRAKMPGLLSVLKEARLTFIVELKPDNWYAFKYSQRVMLEAGFRQTDPIEIKEYDVKPF